MDGNLTSDLAQTEPLSPNYGDLYYDNATKEIFSYYVGYAGDQNEGEVHADYHQAFGTPELNGTIIDRILWTKDTFKANILRLNDRNVTRRYVEYVVQGDGEFASPSMDFGTPEASLATLLFLIWRLRHLRLKRGMTMHLLMLYSS